MFSKFNQKLLPIQLMNLFCPDMPWSLVDPCDGPINSGIEIRPNSEVEPVPAPTALISNKLTFLIIINLPIIVLYTLQDCVIERLGLFYFQFSEIFLLQSLCVIMDEIP